MATGFMVSKKKIGIICVCLNQPYWQYIQEMLWGLDTFFLKHHSIRDKYQVDMLLWTDIPELNDEKFFTKFKEQHVQTPTLTYEQYVAEAKTYFGEVRKKAKIFPTEPLEWPMPTLMRYHLFLQQEEELRNYDYLFYIDTDMRITDWISEEILGDGLTASQHPMYALRRNYQPPYEPNPESSAYIPRPGRIIEEDSKKKFEPLYFAGGFQGGRTEDFIKAMKVMRKNIDEDFNRNYVAIWNDETHWNKYLFENPPSVVLNPAYIYPDSLVADYYVKLWGRNYSPKIMTLTKAFSTDTKGGQAVHEMMATM